MGNKKILEGLSVVKTNVDSGVFNACQEAAIEALDHPEPFCSELRSIYEKRRDVLVPALSALGLKCQKPNATLYVWAKIPDKESSEEFVMKLIREKGIVSTPGSGFGVYGEGFVRFTLCLDLDMLKRVAEMMRSSL